MSGANNLQGTKSEEYYHLHKFSFSFFASLDSLPKTSIIICFHNEAWSTLLRSIFSVLNRSPAHLVHEILLVDDASTMDHLKEDLDVFVAETPKLRLLRLSFRQGLVRTS